MAKKDKAEGQPSTMTAPPSDDPAHDAPAMPPPVKPAHPLSIARIVHFTAPGQPPIAAIVTGLGDENTASLTVFPAGGAPYPKMNVPPASDGAVGWAWPPRV